MSFKKINKLIKKVVLKVEKTTYKTTSKNTLSIIIYFNKKKQINCKKVVEPNGATTFNLIILFFNSIKFQTFII